MPSFYKIRLAGCLLLFILSQEACRKDAGNNSGASLKPGTPFFLAFKLRVNQSIGGYYAGIPEQYNERLKKYPALVFLHGLGQMGNGSSDLDYILSDGMGKVFAEKRFPAAFTVNGKSFSFLVFCPQFSRRPPIDDIDSFFHYIIQHYRIDTSRMYLSGLSLGAQIVTEFAGRHPSRLAAIVPISGAATSSRADSLCEAIAKADIPSWFFHNSDDPMDNLSGTEKFVSLIERYNPSLKPKLTIFPVYGHDAWTTALDPGYKEDGLNMYEWLLQYSR